MATDVNGQRLWKPGEVAALFRVDPKTVTRWATAGRIDSVRTLGGHYRFRESAVYALLDGPPPDGPDADDVYPPSPPERPGDDPGSGRSGHPHADVTEHPTEHPTEAPLEVR